MNYRKHPKFSSRDEGKQDIPARCIKAGGWQWVAEDLPTASDLPSFIIGQISLHIHSGSRVSYQWWLSLNPVHSRSVCPWLCVCGRASQQEEGCDEGLYWRHKTECSNWKLKTLRLALCFLIRSKLTHLVHDQHALFLKASSLEEESSASTSYAPFSWAGNPFVY